MLDSSDEESGGFKINEAYASKYNEWRRREELQKLRDRYGVDAEKEEEDSSSSESEDEDAEALTPQLEEDWLKTLAALKSKDPRIYDKSVKFYHSDEESSNSSSERPGPSKKKDKPVYLKDYHRKVILEKDGKISEEDSDDLEEEVNHGPGYYEEQEEIKKSFKAKLAQESDSEEELFTTRSKTKEQEEEEERDYIKWLKDQKDLEETDPVGVELASLKSYWNNPKLNANEKFLRDLILNKGYIDKDSKRLPSYSEIVDDGEGFSEEEEMLEREDQFERKYNFRFEEPDPDFIKSYPRTVKDSLRQTSSKRADKRQEVKKRKEMEKRKVKEEIKQLKNMKRREIMDKIDKLREITGDPALEFQEEDLETDFDPQKHDEMMKKYFNDDFYEMDEGDQKPEAPADIEDLQCENWDEWAGGETEEQNEEDYQEDYQGDYQEGYEPHADDPDFCMDDDYDPTAVVSKKKNKKKRSKFAQAVTSSKPTFDPNEKTFEEYFEEYYKLDYEDIVAGQPCRFRYRRVTPNSYGLVTEEILKCRDKELNAWVSVKKMSQYRTTDEEEREVKIFESKGKNERKKKNILLSLKEEAEEKQAKKEKDISMENTSEKSKKRKFSQNDVTEKEGQVKKSKKEETKASSNKTQEVSSKKSDSGNLLSLKKAKTDKPDNKNVEKDMNDGKLKAKSAVQSGEGKIQGSETGLSKKQKKKRRKKADAVEKSSSVKEVSNNDQGDRLSGGVHDEGDKKSGPGKSRESQGVSQSQQEEGKGKGKKKRNKKKKKKEGPPKLSSERLLAFGINPKKVKYMNINNFKEKTEG